MARTVVDEYDRPLSEAEQAVVEVRRAAFAAVCQGADINAVLAEARCGSSLGVKFRLRSPS